MKFNTLILASVLSLAVAPIAFAGSGHDHGAGGHGTLPNMIDEKGAIAAATMAVSAIIEQSLDVEGAYLDAAWIATNDADKKIGGKGNGYYIVSFDNNATGKTLYLLLSDRGEVYDANYSGKFEGLE